MERNEEYMIWVDLTYINLDTMEKRHEREYMYEMDFFHTQCFSTLYFRDEKLNGNCILEFEFSNQIINVNVRHLYMIIPIKNKIENIRKIEDNFPGYYESSIKDDYLDIGTKSDFQIKYKDSLITLKEGDYIASGKVSFVLSELNDETWPIIWKLEFYDYRENSKLIKQK